MSMLYEIGLFINLNEKRVRSISMKIIILIKKSTERRLKCAERGKIYI